MPLASIDHSNQAFYNVYHRWNRNRAAKKIIGENNFTYFYTIKLLHRATRLIYSNSEPRVLNILDVGCGVGTIGFYLAAQGHEVRGIDISSDAIEMARLTKRDSGLDNISFQIADVGELSSSTKYDLIICSEVIEHVKDDAKLLRDIVKLLKSNGVLLLTTPSIHAPLYKLGLLKGFDQQVGHLRRYELTQLTNLIKKSGFSIVYTEKNESILRNMLFINPILGKSIRFIRGPLVPLFHLKDNLLTKLFGESDLAVIAQKSR